MNFDYSDILTIVLSSSVLASVMTVFGDRWLNKDNYKRDYHRKLLDKRIEAYEAVERIIGTLGQQSQLTDGRLSPSICCAGQRYFGEFLISMMACLHKATWLSDETSNKLTEINVFLMSEIENKIDENYGYDIQLQELGAQCRDDIKHLRADLIDLLYKDLRTLHEIEPFINRTKTYSGGHLLEKKPSHLQKRRGNDTN